MALGEFDLIGRWFRRPQDVQRGRVDLGVGDDCALLRVQPGEQWAVSTDTLVEGRHFLSTVDPAALGHKALAVNLSDLAACGAQPQACTLALTLPRVEEDWLEGFAQGFHALADAHGIVLAGGDTTAGPLSLTVTVMGTVPSGAALRRDGAQAGDDLWVSHPVDGGIGEARLALEVFRGRISLERAAFEHARLRMERPDPRVALGLALRGLAHSAIDLSDGLIGDLGHVCRASGLAAEVEWTRLPSSALIAVQPPSVQRECLLAGGDDYELLFSAAAARRSDVQAAAAACGLAVTRIGRLTAGVGLVIRDEHGQALPAQAVPVGFDHFRGDPHD